MSHGFSVTSAGQRKVWEKMAKALSRDQEGGCEMPAERKASRKQKGNASRKHLAKELRILPSPHT